MTSKSDEGNGGKNSWSRMHRENCAWVTREELARVKRLHGMLPPDARARNLELWGRLGLLTLGREAGTLD